MSRIFLSHASDDAFEVAALRDWLAREGWDDVFLDFDPARGIAAGERWERALYEAATRCEAVIFLVSAAWLRSGWCRKEYALARALNKRLFAVLVDPALTVADLPDELKGTWQVVDLARGQDVAVLVARPPGRLDSREVGFAAEGLQRLRRGLSKAGLDPEYFAWPPRGEPDRAPYRGLEPLTAADAGILFGRDAPIVEAVDRVRGLAAGAGPRLLVILGSSGAGKSSFLRAGLLPRLARDDAHLLPLRPVRPGRAPLFGDDGLLGSLLAACPGHDREEMRAAIEGGAPALRPILAGLAARSALQPIDRGRAPAPALVLAVDQAEELLRGDNRDGERFLEIVRDLVLEDAPRLVVVFAIRSDSYDGLERARPLEGLPQSALPLLPMPRAAFKDVIEGPARRVVEAGRKLAVEPLLTERLLADIGSGAGGDTLPLLAFTLEQLYLARGRGGELRAADYDAIGGLGGAIEAAVARALARASAVPGAPSGQSAREALLRRGLIPWLAGVDPDTRAPRRNVARRSEIPAEALPLVDLLVEERLLSTDTAPVRDLATGEDRYVATIEPAHEALLRQWGLLSGWLQEDFARLAALEGVQRAARDWDANGRGDAWLTHRGERLTEVSRLDERPDIASRLGPVDRAYVARSRTREEEERAELDARRREREAEGARRIADAEALARADRRTAQRTRIGLSVALVLALVAGGFGLFARQQRNAAQTALATATSTANTLIFDLAREFRDVAGMPASLVKSILDRALRLQDELIGSGQTSLDLLSSQANGLGAASRTLVTVGDTGQASAFAKRATSIWRSLLARRPDDPALRSGLAAALIDGGDADLLAGDQPAALAAFGESLAISRALAAGTDDPARRTALATALQRLGDAKSAGGDRTGALAAYQEGLALYRAVAAVDPNPSIKVDVAHSLDRIGSIRAVLGDREGAVAAFEEAVRLRREVLAANPADAVAQRDLAWTLGLYGEFKEQSGDRGGALAMDEESLRLRRDIAQDRSNARAQRDLSVALNRVAILRKLTGDIAGAERAIAEAVAIARDFARDARNAEAQRNLALTLQSEGDVRAEAGDGAGALKAYGESLTILRGLAANASAGAAARDLALILDSIGDLKASTGDRDGALQAYRESLAIKRRRAEDKEDAEAQRDFGIGLDQTGDVELAAGDPRGALAIYEESLALFRRLADGTGGPQPRRDLELAFKKVGEAKAALRDRAGAIAAFEAALAIARDYARDQSFSTAKRDLAGILSELGNLKLASGDGAGALLALDECLRLVIELDSDKGDLRSLQELLGVAQKVAQLKLRADDRAGALAAYEVSLAAIRGTLRLGDDPAVRGRLVDILGAVGMLRLQAGDKAGALAAFEDSLEPARALARAGGEAARKLGFILDNVGVLKRQLGDAAGAKAAFTESLELRRRLAAVRAGPDAQRDLAISLDHLGGLAMDREDYAEALGHYRTALELRRGVQPTPGTTAPDEDMLAEVEQLGAVSYRSLFRRLFDQSLAAADLAISCAPEMLWLHTNRAHALMFLGRTDEARRLYLAYRGRQAQEDQTWEQSVLGDFAELRKAGLTAPLMDEIETALKQGPR